MSKQQRSFSLYIFISLFTSFYLFLPLNLFVSAVHITQQKFHSKWNSGFFFTKIYLIWIQCFSMKRRLNEQYGPLFSLRNTTDRRYSNGSSMQDMSSFENLSTSFENKPPYTHTGRSLFYGRNLQKAELSKRAYYAYLFTSQSCVPAYYIGFP